MPSPTQFRAAAAQAGLQVVDAFSFRHDYAETLRRWHKRFTLQKTQIQLLGFDPNFQRTWEFYLAYCEAAFDMKNTDVVQFTLVKA